MNSIDPRARAALEAARRANGQFGDQQHSAPDHDLAAGTTGWSLEQVDAAHYEPPMTLAGFQPPDEDIHDLYRGMVWARERGDRPEDIAVVRRFAGQMPDDDFKELYDQAQRVQHVDGDKWEAFGDFELDVRAAMQRSGGAVAEDFLPDAGIASEGYMGGSKFEGHLADTTRGLSQAEVGKRIRADVKAAKDAGYLPENLKVSVRSNRGSMVSSFSVSAEIPDELAYRSGMRPWDGDDRLERLDPGDYVHNPYYDRKHPFAAELSDRLERVTNRYASTDTNSMVDYFDSYHEARVTVEGDDVEARDERYREAQERTSEWARRLLGR
ncbi:MAG: hypothetical protein ACTH0V_00720 [Microbacteriaceae bacterium]